VLYRLPFFEIFLSPFNSIHRQECNMGAEQARELIIELAAVGSS